MKIIFLCGSLEPGRDGVGDYTRRLGIELIKQGHKIAAVALNDSSVADILFSRQYSDNIELPVLRLPNAMSEKKYFGLVKKWINDFDPDLLSLQFVPFSFHSKGLPFGLSEELKKIGYGKQWHIMFHELWVGLNKEATSKEIIWGSLQQFLIKRLVLHLQPKYTQTHCELYLQQLATIGVNASYLSLFTNIPESNNSAVSGKVFAAQKKSISLLLFGNIHPGAPVEQFATEAAKFAVDNNVQVDLTLIGRCGTEQEHWIDVWKKVGLSVNLLGEQTPEYISTVMSKATFGIVTTPLALVEKSGAVAAMLSHRLPVLCVSKPWQPRIQIQLNLPHGIIEYTEGNLEKCLTKAPTVDAVTTVADVCHQFMESILTSA